MNAGRMSRRKRIDVADTQILQEFLIALGFNVKGKDEFNKTVTATTAKVVALGAATVAAAAAVIAGTAKIADNLEQLYFTSQRTKASAENIQAFGFAVQNLGGDAGAAIGSLESLARMLRNSPGTEGLLQNIGVQTRTANGQLRDSVELMADLGDKLRAMPTYQANAYAQTLGLDEKTVFAMREGVGEFSREYRDMLRAAGADSQKAASGAHDFMVQLRMLRATGDILIQTLGARLFGPVGARVQSLRENVASNFDRIGRALEFGGRALAGTLDVIVAFAVRGGQAVGVVADWYNGLSESQQSLIKWFGAALVAWRVLNAGFLATPLGQVLALGAAIVALWDDYQTWKDGGDSLIDWGKWSPYIDAAIAGIKTLGNAIHETLGITGDFRPLLELVLAYVAGRWVLGMVASFATVGASAVGATGAVMGLLGKLGLVGAAAAGGWAIGTVINDQLSTDTKDAIGEGVTKALAFFGNEDAKKNLKNMAGRGSPEPTATPSAVAPTATPAGKPPARAGASPGAEYGTERGLRNNNPGNINYGAFAKEQGATGVEPGAGGRFAQFASAQDGLNAVNALLARYVANGTDTITKIISKYAPASDNNNTAAYIASVAKKLGMDADTKVDYSNPETRQGLISAIVQIENGRNPYSPEMLRAAAMSGTQGKQAQAAPVQITQTNTVTVNAPGSASPEAVGDATARAQASLNAQLVRNYTSAVKQ